MNRSRVLCLSSVLVLIFTSLSPSADGRARPDLLVAEWDELIDEQVSAVNPLHEESGEENQNPLYEPKSVVFNSSDFWQGVPIRMEVQLDNILPPGVLVPGESYVFDVKVSNQATGDPITQFPNGLTFGFEIPGLTQEQEDDLTLGFLDESKNPPEWTSVDGKLDKCLSHDDKQLYCGTTDHLTTFVIGPSSVIPEPSSLVLLGLGALAFLNGRRRK